MISILRAADLWTKPMLTSTMFSDRRKQFRNGTGWLIDVDSLGNTPDGYDAKNPLYIIIENSEGCHAGSMRLLPTGRRAAMSENCTKTGIGHNFHSSSVWECTNFCVSQEQEEVLSAVLLTAAARIMQEVGLEKIVTVFDCKMTALYKKVGVNPQIVSKGTYQRRVAFTGWWACDRHMYQALLLTSGLDPAYLELVFANVEIPWLK